MSIYLVDYENVNADGFRGIEKLGKNDSVYVFYTTNAGNLSFEAHKKLVESRLYFRKGHYSEHIYNKQ